MGWNSQLKTNGANKVYHSYLLRIKTLKTHTSFFKRIWLDVGLFSSRIKDRTELEKKTELHSHIFPVQWWHLEKNIYVAYESIIQISSIKTPSCKNLLAQSIIPCCQQKRLINVISQIGKKGFSCLLVPFLILFASYRIVGQTLFD